MTPEFRGGKRGSARVDLAVGRVVCRADITVVVMRILPRDARIAVLLSSVVRPSVCLSVRPSVRPSVCDVDVP